MTDDELLKESYDKILIELNNTYLHYKKDNFDYTAELLEDFSDTMEILKDILKDGSSVESLKKLDEEDYAFMYELLNDYAETFVIDGRTKDTLSRDTKKYEQLLELLSVLQENYVPQEYDCKEDDDFLDNEAD